MKKRRLTDVLIVSAVYALFANAALAGPTKEGQFQMPESKKAAKGVLCREKNSCSGAGSCKSEANSCKGQNGCDNHSYYAPSAKKCTAAKGTVVNK